MIIIQSVSTIQKQLTTIHNNISIPNWEQSQSADEPTVLVQQKFARNTSKLI